METQRVERNEMDMMSSRSRGRESENEQYIVLKSVKICSVVGVISGLLRTESFLKRLCMYGVLGFGFFGQGRGWRIWWGCELSAM